jgi:ABC-type uncharacterized transport system substrate-binding protein
LIAFLKDAKLGDLPFQRSTKSDLRINLRIAKALGIELWHLADVGVSPNVRFAPEAAGEGLR